LKSTQRQVIIAGNWKMHKTAREAVALTEEIQAAIANEKILPEIVVVPPFTALPAVEKCLKKSLIKLGAQNLDWHDEGAFTGEISPLMLTDLNVQYVLVGHSERRQHFGETNTTVPLRIKAALAHGLKPILCVGELIDEREAGLTDAVVGRQVGAALSDLNPDQFAQVAVAYEPVWAIGTGNHCAPAEANRVCAMIRKTVAALQERLKDSAENGDFFNASQLPILYGGSVKASNIAEQIKQEHIDGALVGGASLKAEEFVAIIKAAQERVKKSGKATSAAR
jgi:triosephosphate isomerase (TIM)